MTSSLSGTIRLALDQGLPRDAAVFPRQTGYECLHVSEVGMSQAEDTEILEWARSTKAVVVTLDADFHAALAGSGATEPSVVRLRLEGQNATAVTSLVQRVLAAYPPELRSGCMITVKTRKTTSHV